MISAIEQEPLILASQSPRRRYLLEQAGLAFTIVPSRFDERNVPLGHPENYVRILSDAKANDIARRHPDTWVIGADTIVLIEGRVLGKPEDRDAAQVMLRRLSGQIHQVWTGFTLCHHQNKMQIGAAVATDVEFKSLSEQEIEWYVHTEEPFDKAGAYAIQGLGTFLVRRINGSYTNVVGLPVCEVIEMMIEHRIIRMATKR